VKGKLSSKELTATESSIDFVQNRVLYFKREKLVTIAAFFAFKNNRETG